MLELLDTRRGVRTVRSSKSGVERGIPYNDLGAIATDLSGIDLTSNIIVNNGVFYNIVDMYQVTYDVSDNFGNQASRVIRNAHRRFEISKIQSLLYNFIAIEYYHDLLVPSRSI